MHLLFFQVVNDSQSTVFRHYSQMPTIGTECKCIDTLIRQFPKSHGICLLYLRMHRFFDLEFRRRIAVPVSCTVRCLFWHEGSIILLFVIHNKRTIHMCSHKQIFWSWYPSNLGNGGCIYNTLSYVLLVSRHIIIYRNFRLTFLFSLAYFWLIGSYQMISPVENPIIKSTWFDALVTGLTSWHKQWPLVKRIFDKGSCYSQLDATQIKQEYYIPCWETTCPTTGKHGLYLQMQTIHQLADLRVVLISPRVQ